MFGCFGFECVYLYALDSYGSFNDVMCVHDEGLDTDLYLLTCSETTSVIPLVVKHSAAQHVWRVKTRHAAEGFDPVITIPCIMLGNIL